MTIICIDPERSLECDLWLEDVFRWWIEAQPEGAALGNIQRDAECPLARYLRFYTQEEWFVGTEEARRFLPEIIFIPLPTWARTFIRSSFQDDLVIRENALRVLRENAEQAA